MEWFLYDRDLRLEGVSSLKFAWYHKWNLERISDFSKFFIKTKRITQKYENFENKWKLRQIVKILRQIEQNNVCVLNEWRDGWMNAWMDEWMNLDSDNPERSWLKVFMQFCKICEFNLCARCLLSCYYSRLVVHQKPVQS